MDLLRLKTSNPQGVGLLTMPLRSLMEEFRNNSNGDIATITMDGQIKGAVGDAITSDSMEALLSGKYKLILATEEAFNSPTGRLVTDELSDKKRILFVGKDEGHKGLQDDWGGEFRKEMYYVPAQIRTQANKGSPCMVTSATLTLKQIAEVKTMMKIHKNVVIIR